jgi:hypothetical protein
MPPHSELEGAMQKHYARIRIPANRGLASGR